jgi:hypothetical protein
MIQLLMGGRPAGDEARGPWRRRALSTILWVQRADTSRTTPGSPDRSRPLSSEGPGRATTTRPGRRSANERDALKFELSRFFRRRDANEEWLARYLVTQARRGRRTVDVLQDPVVLRHADAGTRARVLDRSDVIDALAEHAVAHVREEIARGGMRGRRRATRRRFG